VKSIVGALTAKRAAMIVAMRKVIQETADDVYYTARSSTFVRDERPHNSRWRLRMWAVDGNFRAQLSDGATHQPIVGLDHHHGWSMSNTGERIHPGYHWDVHQPLGHPVKKIKIAIDNILPDPYDAFRLVCAMWCIEVVPARQPRLL
jgi:hypothetical protein